MKIYMPLQGYLDFFAVSPLLPRGQAEKRLIILNHAIFSIDIQLMTAGRCGGIRESWERLVHIWLIMSSINIKIAQINRQRRRSSTGY
ncbi:MAG: hypothetical protein DBY45_06020 [Clostridiales bacterium]|nr:MAG: hypothetical protein DBY45_06020 [Clostridiales bacterium]